MNQPPAHIEILLQDIPREKAPSFMSVYANLVNVGFTFNDARLIFCQFVTSMNKGNAATVTIQEQVAVTMTWEQTKVLSQALQEAVSNYEKTHGAVRVNTEETPTSLSTLPA